MSDHTPGPFKYDPNANARLREAAPDLLQAVEAGKAYAEALGKYASKAARSSGQLVTGQDLDDLFEAWMDLTDKALGKVKGDTR
jgi:hypothetical protein